MRRTLSIGHLPETDDFLPSHTHHQPDGDVEQRHQESYLSPESLRDVACPKDDRGKDGSVVGQAGVEISEEEQEKGGHPGRRRTWSPDRQYIL